MKNIRIVVTGLAIAGVMLGGVAPAMAQTSTSSLQSLIQSLQSQLAALRAQVDALRAAQTQVATTAGEIKNTLKLIAGLREGMSGEDVKLLQAALAADPEVYPEGLITGFYGRLTAQAVKKFQKLHDLEQVGNVGPKTLKKLNEFLEKNLIAREDDDDEDEDDDDDNGGSGKGRFCVIVPPGHLIAPGWLRKHDGERPIIPVCQVLPPGILAQLSSSTPPGVPDVTAPVISAVAATGVTHASAHIVWTTNEAANGTVWYATSSPVVAGTSTPSASSASLVLNHDLALSGLAANTTYYFVVRSADASGNATTSGQFSFATAAAPDTTAPVISAATSTDIASSTARITWTTDEAATSKVMYSTSTPVSAANALTVSSGALVTAHSVPLVGLTASTTYYYTVSSADAAGNNATSSEFSFTTLAP